MIRDQNSSARASGGAVDVPPVRVPFLDALRGLAALSVIIVHIVLMPSPPLAIPIAPFTLIWIGSTGVCVFFAVSTYSLCYTMPSRLREARPLTSFYLRRVFRIAPLFYFWLGVRLLHDYWTADRVYPLGEIAANVTFTFNLIPAYVESIVLAGWTVGVEEVFYATFPLMFRWVRGITSALVLCVVTALVATGTRWFLATLDPSAPWVFNLQRWSFAIHAQTFAMGALAFYLAPHVARLFVTRHSRIASSTLVGLAIGFLLMPARFWGPLSLYLPWQGIICLLLIVGLQVRSLPIIDNPLTRYLGRISFSFYLCHPLVIAYLIPVYGRISATIQSPNLSLLCCVLLTCAILIPIAELTYRLIEERGVEAGRALYRRIARGDRLRHGIDATPN